MINPVENFAQGRPRTNALLTGIFFIMASASAIAGMQQYGIVMGDNLDFADVLKNRNQVSSGALFEMILVCSNIGTGIMLLPYLRLYNERLGLGYICFRFLEAVLIAIGITTLLAIPILGSMYSERSATNMEILNVQARSLKAIHDWTFILGPHFVLGINTFIYSYVFLKSGWVPRKLAVMGMIGAVLVFLAANLELFHVVKVNTPVIILMALPIALYEMILAVWLILRGFKFKNEQIWS